MKTIKHYSWNEVTQLIDVTTTNVPSYEDLQAVYTGTDSQFIAKLDDFVVGMGYDPHRQIKDLWYQAYLDWQEFKTSYDNETPEWQATQEGMILNKRVETAFYQMEMLETGILKTPDMSDVSVDNYFEETVGDPLPWLSRLRGETPVETIPVVGLSDPNLVAFVKTICKERENTKRTALEFGGFEYNGNRFDTDLKSVMLLNSKLTWINQGNTLPVGFTWRSEDNQDIPMDNAGLTAMAQAMNDYIEPLYPASWSRKDAVDACTTYQEIKDIYAPPPP